MKNTIYSLLAIVMKVFSVECSAQTVSGNKDGHDYVDLGLPSGRLWATCNVGASKPTEYGDYFAWGETSPKDNYTWATYKYEEESYKNEVGGDGSYRGCSKYTIADRAPIADWGFVDVDCVAWYDRKGNFIGDNLTTLLAEDDAATANWGVGWCMPTIAELIELENGCDWKWTDKFNGNRVAGRIGKSKTNGNTIFLPAAGNRDMTDPYAAGSEGYYWSSSLSEKSSNLACCIYFASDIIDWNTNDRYLGRSVRAVVK